jgi:hypothetical protein
MVELYRLFLSSHFQRDIFNPFFLLFFSFFYSTPNTQTNSWEESVERERLVLGAGPDRALVSPDRGVK